MAMTLEDLKAKTGTWKKDEIKELFIYPRAVEKGIVAIFHRQTEDEKRSDDTKHENGIGFNGVDAHILSSFAKQIIKGKRLSPKQLAIAEKKIKKYAGQLAKIANGQI